jgi:hypothetical protein
LPGRQVDLALASVLLFVSGSVQYSLVNLSNCNIS